MSSRDEEILAIEAELDRRKREQTDQEMIAIEAELQERLGPPPEDEQAGGWVDRVFDYIEERIPAEVGKAGMQAVEGLNNAPPWVQFAAVLMAGSGIKKVRDYFLASRKRTVLQTPGTPKTVNGRVVANARGPQKIVKGAARRIWPVAATWAAAEIVDAASKQLPNETDEDYRARLLYGLENDDYSPRPGSRPVN